MVVHSKKWLQALVLGTLLVLAGRTTAAEPAAQRQVSVCYTPWWTNWRLPTSLNSDLPLLMVAPEEQQKYSNAEQFEAWAYQRSIRAMERGGIDIVCWDTFGEPQIQQCKTFIQALGAIQSPVKVAPYLDVHESNNPNETKVIENFRTSLQMFHALPDFAAHWASPYYYTWGTRNLPPAIWDRVLAGLQKGVGEGKWIAHVNSGLDSADVMTRNRGYLNSFDALYSWQPAPLSEVQKVEGNLKAVVDQAGQSERRYIASCYPMFRRYGYGIAYVNPFGFQLFRKTWDNAIAASAPEVHLVTWNDYEEDTMLEPTISRGFCLLDLNRYYTDRWKGLTAEPATTRCFLAYPHGVNAGESAYVDFTGLFASKDLPVRVQVWLEDSAGRRVYEAPEQTIAASGIQSVLLPLKPTRAWGESVRPRAELTMAGGQKRILGSDLPWMDLYDAGALRDRNPWMVEPTDKDASISIQALNQDGGAVPEGYTQRLQIQVKWNSSEPMPKYFVLKRNGELAAIVHHDTAYMPTAGWGGDWGWTSYDQVRKVDATTVAFTEPPCKYGLPKCGGAVSKWNRNLTGFSRDWYSIVAVTEEGQRSFSPPVVVSRKPMDDMIASYESMHVSSGVVRDDTLKGLDLKDFSATNPLVLKEGNRASLVLNEKGGLLLPNELLASQRFSVALDLKLLQRAPAAVIWSTSGELQLYIDNAMHLIARRNQGQNRFATVRSLKPLPANDWRRVEVKVEADQLTLLLDGAVQETVPCVTAVESDSGVAHFGWQLPAEVSTTKTTGPAFSLAVARIAVRAVP